MASVIKIGVIDDDRMFRGSVVSWLTAETKIRATAFPSLPEFLAAGSAPGIVTLDLHLGDGSMPGENVRALTAAGHKVVVMTVVPPKQWIGDVTAAGYDFAAPRRRDTKAWSVVAAVLAEGLTYDHRPGCGCSRLPSFRPRTQAQVRVRRRAAERLGLPLSVTLARRDAFTPESRDEQPPSPSAGKRDAT
ncbi:hypothetical protein OG592_02425 [Streptomyces avidinii]|uniref:hypothetical protein n=1 Tax=Streptomyces avidinii TaxID=1895 RepID=UPI0038657955|nr:hypothetical protein OG592_02425 [Streptomyces avidinii]